MATTVEYIIILTGYLECRGRQVTHIHITDTDFILFDVNSVELARAKRMGGSSVIVSDFIDQLSFGTVLRFLTGSKELFTVSDEDGEQQIECNVTIPEEGE